MQTPEFTSKADKQTEILEKISNQLTTVSKDQKHIGEFIGESIHSIRKWIIFFGILTIINIIVTVFF